MKRHTRAASGILSVVLASVIVFSVVCSLACGLPGGGKAKLVGDYADYGADVDEDDGYDFLTIDVRVLVRVPGEYSLMGFLYDSEDQEVAWAADHKKFSSGYHTMRLEFEGETIRKCGADGPYGLEKLLLSSGSSETGLETCDYVQEACTTSAYNSTDFAKNISAEGPATSFPVGTVSGNGSGELLLTFTVRDTVPVSSGRYSYDVVGINIPPISTPWNVTGSRLGYAYDLPGLYMPNKPNNFTVTAEGVKNLNIGLKKLQGDRTRMWVTTQIGAAEDGRATTETDLISPGPYHAKIFGDAAEDASQVNLIMTMVKKIVVEGRFSLSLDTTGFPSGEYMIAVEAVNGSFSFDEIAIGGLTVAG